MFSSLKRAFQINLCHLIDNLVNKFIRPKIKAKTLLILRLDAIGDYILFRNFLEVLAKSKKYQGYNITLCGNKIWQDLAQEWDFEFVDSFIWLDRKKFYHDAYYRFEFQKQIRAKGFEVVLNPVFSRLILFGDALVKVSGAKKRIGNFGNTDNLIPKEKKIADKYYSKLIQPSPKILFEFDRNKEFFENLLEEKINLKSPQIVQVKKNKKSSLIVFAGASEAYKRWHWKKFATLALQIAQKYDLEVILVGSKTEIEITDSIVVFLKTHNSTSSTSIKFTNLTAQTSLLELSQIIADSELLLTNETVAVHLAVATQTKAICLANGRHFGRFSPYPKKYDVKVSYIFPPEIEKVRFDEEKTALKYCNSSGLTIDEIEIETVFEEAKMILK
jgi:ADP-heptose:LPS heptosyltransferase